MNLFPKKVNFINRERGQSLVEAALVFPIFIMLIAGVVEVSHVLITKNRVEAAARAATRFAASGGEASQQVALNTVTDTLDLSSGYWDIWTIEAAVNQNGDGFLPGDGWQVDKVFGISITQSYTDVVAGLDPDCVDGCIDDAILKDLQTDPHGVHLDPVADPSVRRIAADLKIVGTLIIHDIDSVIGLSAFPGLSGLYSVQAISIMRTPEESGLGQQSNGCDGFPIAVHEGVRSLTDVGGGNPYPDARDFDYPDPPPEYADFYKNISQVPLRDAKEGYIYKVHDGFGSGNFGWLLWNEGRPASANTLADSLSWPGDSIDYSDHGDHSISPATPLYPHIVRGYVEPTNALDTALHVGDWVAANTGSVNANAVRDALASHVDLANSGRTLRLLVWDDAEQQGNNGRYKIIGFIVVKLHGYSLSQNEGGSWILVEFVRWDTSCGQVSQ